MSHNNWENSFEKTLNDRLGGPFHISKFIEILMNEMELEYPMPDSHHEKIPKNDTSEKLEIQ
jgi:hypothetical protein